MYYKQHGVFCVLFMGCLWLEPVLGGVIGLGWLLFIKESVQHIMKVQTYSYYSIHLCKTTDELVDHLEQGQDPNVWLTTPNPDPGRYWCKPSFSYEQPSMVQMQLCHLMADNYGAMERLVEAGCTNQPMKYIMTDDIQDGPTPLHLTKDPNVAKLLLKNGADVTQLCQNKTPLHSATPETLPIMLEQNISPEILGQTLLHHLDHHADRNIIWQLILAGADVNASTEDPMCALELAPTMEMAEWLLDHGAKLDQVKCSIIKVPDMVSYFMGRYINLRLKAQTNDPFWQGLIDQDNIWSHVLLYLKPTFA